MRREYMLVAEGKQMIVYRANIMIKINGSVTNTWIEIEAANANTARALLQAQYGKENVINVIRKSGQ
jgi:hypothetical protein